MEQKCLELLCVEKEIFLQLDESIKNQMKELSANIEKYEDLKNIVLSNDATMRELIAQAQKDQEIIAQYKNELTEKNQQIIEYKKYDDVRLDALTVTKILDSVQKKEKELIEKKTKYESEINKLKTNVEDLEGNIEHWKNIYQTLDTNYNQKVVELRNVNEVYKEEMQKKEEEWKNKESEIRKENEALKEENEKLKKAQQKISDEEIQRLQNMEKDYNQKIEQLTIDHDWLLAYAIATDQKIVNLKKGDGDDFNKHAQWLIGTSKIDNKDYMRVFGEDQFYQNTVEVKGQDELEKFQEKNETGPQFEDAE